MRRSAPPLAVSPPTAPPPDLSTVWYIALVLGAVGLARSAPWAGQRAPDSLVGSDEASYGSLYLLTSLLYLCAYLPAAFGLARRGGGAPLALLGAVVVLVVASAPLEAIFRTRHDASAPVRRILARAALGAWLGALARTPRRRLAALVAFVAIVLCNHIEGARLAKLAIEAVTFATLHLDLAFSGTRVKRASALAWRLVVPLGAAPTLVVALTPLLLASGHSLFGMHERPVNHAGLPLCAFRHATAMPATVAEVQALVAAHRSVRARGGRHSWSSHACPATPGSGGLVLDTRLLRSVDYDAATETVAAGAGTSFGTLQNVLHRHNRMLASNWHKDVTLAGGCATSASHLGVSISELVTSLDVVYANGTLGTVREVDAEFPFHFGSIGMLGLVVGARLRTLPRTSLDWTSVSEPYTDNDAALAARVATWADDDVAHRSSVLWVLPALRETTLQIATYGAPLAPADNATWRTAPHLQRHHFGDVGLTFSVFNNALALAVGLADPLSLGVSDAVAAEGMRAFVSTPHLPTTGLVDEANNRLPTYVASVEMAVVVGRAHLEACVRALATFPVAMALHLRYAPLQLAPISTSGPQTYFVDFSLPESTLARLQPHIEEADAACPAPVRTDGFAASTGHAGKLNLADLRERRVWRAPAPATLPGRTASADHVRFRQLIVALDPLAKFRPYQG